MSEVISGGLPHSIPTIEQIVSHRETGPWTTKSNAQLTVQMKMPVGDYLSYDKDELARIPEDIRGIRIYSVLGMPEGSVGGKEFHRVRQEIIMVRAGTLKCVCEDLLGNKRVCLLGPGNGVQLTPFILHTLISVENGTDLLVLANTLFNPDDPRTHDTYSAEEFERLKGEVRKDQTG
jgi:hypothetical protein